MVKIKTKPKTVTVATTKPFVTKEQWEKEENTAVEAKPTEAPRTVNKAFQPTVAKVVYDETGDLLLQLRKLCGNRAYVLMHDHSGYYVQVQHWTDEKSASGILKSHWQPITGIHYDQRVSIKEAIDRLVKEVALIPPEPGLPNAYKTSLDASVQPSSPVNGAEEAKEESDAVDRALAELDKEVEEAFPEEIEEELEPETVELDYDELESMLGKQVSAIKKFHGGITDYVAGKFIGKSYQTGNGVEYGVEFRNESGRKRLVAVKPETVKLVPGKEEPKPKQKLARPTQPVQVIDILDGSEAVAANIVAEF